MTSLNPEHSGSHELASSPRQQSAILQELWAVKAQLNAEADYDLDRLIAIVRKEAAPFIDAQGRVRVPVTMPMQLIAPTGV